MVGGIWAYDFKVNGIYYNVTGNSANPTCGVTFETTSYNTYSGTINIPESVTYNGTTFTVNSVCDYAFYKCTGLTAVNFPSTIESIGKYAFAGNNTTWDNNTANNQIMNIYIPSVKKIDDYAFNFAKTLQTVYSPKLESIGEYAFNCCTNLSSISLECVTSIGIYAFYYCENLVSADMPKITKLETAVFSHCLKLKSIYCPELTIIKDCCLMNGVGSSYDHGVFAYCACLKEISIPKLEIIGEISFYRCTTLETVDLPNLTRFPTPTWYGGSNNRIIGAFYGCSKLKYVNIPKVEVFANCPFYGCSSLENIDLPSINNQYIYYSDYPQIWFGECISLKSVTLGKNLSSIPDKAFYNCTALTTINCLNPTPPAVGDAAFYGVSRFNCYLYVPEESIYKYGDAIPWNEFYNIKPIPTTDTYFDATIYVGANGSLTINGATICNSSNKLRLKGGEDYTITITPDNGYQVQQLLVDGNDVTSEITSNSYTLQDLSADVTISVTFETIGIYLTINQGEGGVLKQKIFSGNTCTFSCVTSNNWELSTATYNGRDITSQLKEGMEYTTPPITSNAEICVVYVNTGQTGVKPIPSIDDVKVFAYDGCIRIENHSNEKRVTVYTLSGKLVADEEALFGTKEISLERKCVYLVKIGELTFKVAL